mgnify:CR=1 FL=1
MLIGDHFSIFNIQYQIKAHVPTYHRTYIQVHWRQCLDEVIRFMRYPCVILLQVSLMADVLRRRGADKGDRVIIYMPMIPEALITMLACARIGAVHSLVFGGFSARELSVRVDHCKVCC